MSRGKKIGVILMLIGICIPMLSMLFASDYYPRRNASFLSNIRNADIVCWEMEKKPINPYMKQDEKKDFFTSIELFGGKEKYCIPLSLSFGLGIILIATGIGFVILSKKE